MQSENPLQKQRLSGQFRVAVYLATAILAQVVFWWFSMPGPQLRQPASLSLAISCCLVAVVTLLLGPGLVATHGLRRTAAQLGWGWGDASFGWKALVVCGPLMVIGTLLGATDSQIQEYYPIPGKGIGNSLAALLSWWLSYFLFYVAFEFFYRGFLLRGLSDLSTLGSLTTFLILQALCCCGIHIGKPTAEVIASLPASLVFGAIAWRSRSIWYGTMVHFSVGIANDAAVLWQHGLWLR